MSMWIFDVVEDFGGVVVRNSVQRVHQSHPQSSSVQMKTKCPV
jgi:hypothetical protein